MEKANVLLEIVSWHNKLVSMKNNQEEQKKIMEELCDLLSNCPKKEYKEYIQKIKPIK